MASLRRFPLSLYCAWPSGGGSTSLKTHSPLLGSSLPHNLVICKGVTTPDEADDMQPVEPKDVMVALLGVDATLLGFGLVLMSIVIAFYAADRTRAGDPTYPTWVYIFYWLESLAVIALALVSVFACNDWLVDHAYSHTAKVDASFNLAVRFFDLTLFAIVLVALSMTIPFIVERLGEGRRSTPDKG
jgi:hypothetical protein